MVKCPSCGFGNDDNCTFCAICGSSVTQDDFYVHNNTSASFSVEDLTKKLISKDKQENQKTKSFKKLDKATIAREAAKIELKDDEVKEYKGSSKNNSDKKNTENKKDTSKKDVKIKSNEKNEVKNTESNKPKEDKADKSTISNKETAVEKNKQEVSAVNKDNKTKPIIDKSKDNNSKPITENTKATATESKADTKAKEKESKEDTKEKAKATTKENEVDTKAKEKESKKSEPELNSTENKTTGSDTKKEEKQNKSPELKEEIPDSAKGSTDGKLYNLLSKFFFDTKNETSLFKQKDIDENCSLAMISYIPFLFFVPMIIKPCSGYLRYHGIQGLTMFLSFIVLEFFNIIMGAIFNSVLNEMPGIILTVIVTVIINLAVLLLISIGIANAVKGAARELPIIGKYKLLKQYVY